MSKYEAPQLFVDEFVPDTMIASGSYEENPVYNGASAKNGNPDNNQSCWGCRNDTGQLDPGNDTHACCYLPGDSVYDKLC